MIRPNMERIHEILQKFQEKKILVVGDVGIDLYTIGEVRRISPEAPVPVLEVNRREEKLAMASNVANNIRSLGAEPLLVGVIGKDYNGERFNDILRSLDISKDYLIHEDGRPTTLKERVATERQQIVRVDHESVKPVSSKTESLIIQTVEKLLPMVDAVTMECYGKGMFFGEVAPAIITAAKKNNKLVSLDPNPKSFIEKFRGITITTPNIHEAEIHSGITIREEADFIRAAKILNDKLESRTVIITRGKDGMSIFAKNEEPIHIPTFARKVFDVSGAGDTVISCLTLGICSGATLVEAALIANHAAAVEVGKMGTAVVSRDEILADMVQ